MQISSSPPPTKHNHLQRQAIITLEKICWAGFRLYKEYKFHFYIIFVVLLQRKSNHTLLKIKPWIYWSRFMVEASPFKISVFTYCFVRVWLFYYKLNYQNRHSIIILIKHIVLKGWEIASNFILVASRDTSHSFLSLICEHGIMVTIKGLWFLNFELMHEILLVLFKIKMCISK